MTIVYKQPFLVMATILSMISMQGQEAPMQFPNLKAETLDRQKLTFPADLEGEVHILTLVFEQRAQYIVDTWADIILPEYLPDPLISYHEIPMISGLYYPIAWQVDQWMRSGIPNQYHSNTATFYGNREPYLKALNMNKRTAYVFVLDRNGFIRFRAEGVRTPEAEAQFRQTVAALRGNANP